MSKDMQIQSIFRLTPMQKGILFHSLMNESSHAYFEQVCFTLDGRLDVAYLEQSLTRLFERHEILRSNIFHLNIEEPKLIVFKQKRPEIRFDDISGMDESAKQHYVARALQEDKERGFDLTREELFRAAVIQYAENTYKLIVSFHHIIMDGWCLEIVFNEWLQLYGALQSQEEVQLERVPDYEVYLKWLERQDQEEALTFWTQYLEAFEHQSLLPITHSLVADAAGKYNLSQESVVFEAELTGQLEKLAKDHKVTLSAVFYALWGLLLQKYNNTNDVTFGAVVSGRPTEITGVEQMVGLFINTLPVRIRTESGYRFAELLEQVQQSIVDVNRYHYVSLTDIQSASLLKNNLIHHIIAFENFPGTQEVSGQDEQRRLAVTATEGFEQTNYDFNISVIPGETIKVKFTYNGLLYSSEAIHNLGQHLKNVARTVSSHPELALDAVELLSAPEQEALLGEFNNTEAPYPKERTIHGLFEEQVERTPDRVAVVMGEEQLTYRELNEQANRLARVLREKGVGPDRIVGIAVHRSLEMNIGLMAIHKAGGAYLPIQPEDPVDRVLFTLEDSGAALVLTQRNLLEPLRPLGAERELLGIEDVLEQAAGLSGVNLEPVNVSSDLVYVIYTSGSTGRPKGVMIEHASLINRLNWMQHRMPFGAEDVILQKTPYTFDVSLWELFSWAIQGARLCFLPPGGEKDPGLIADTIEAHGITAIHFVPSMLGAFLDVAEQESWFGRLGSVKRVFTSGEALMSEHVKRFNRLWRASSGATLHNLYGPTEATVEVAYYDCPPEEVPGSIPIGRPLDNVRLYVLDKADRLMPVGVPGELHIGGDCLARGYLNRPDLTAEKFVLDPFVDGGRMYRTGDLARWLPDGNIEYLGRIDHQVKIRGYRIELGEIEAALLAQDGVKESVVLARDDGQGGHFLCAYVASDQERQEQALKERLKLVLPSYMVPTHIVVLDGLPHLSNGKVDRKSLPAPEGRLLGSESIAPRTETEIRLAQIWEKTLGVSGLGIRHDFFEWGGHSLKATQLMTRINKEFQVQFTLPDIFGNPTIETMGALIADPKVESQAVAEIPSAPLQDYYPVTSMQKRLMVLQHLEGAETAYNLPSAMVIEEPLDQARLEEVFQQLIDRHEALRTSFEWVGDEPVQRLCDQVSFQLASGDLSVGDGLEEEQIQTALHAFIRPFDLSAAPLFRAELNRLSDGKHLLLVDMHHIVADGTSIDILMDDFSALYRAEALPKLRIQYKDFAVWHNESLKGGQLREQEQFWLNELSGELPVLNLPTDYPRPQKKSFEGERIAIEADAYLFSKLKKLTTESKTTLFMVLLAAYNVLLHKYSGQEDVTVGSPIAGRHVPDLEKTIGMFVNTLVLRNRPLPEQTFLQFLQQVRETSIRAFQNQDYPIEDVVEQLGVQRDMSRSPLFDVMFSLENSESPELHDHVLSFNPYPLETGISKFDLTLTAEAHGEKLAFRFEYCAKLFRAETIQRMAVHYIRLLEAIVERADTAISDLELLSEAERYALTTEFNNTASDYPKEKTLQRLFEEQVERTPHRTAVVFGDLRWSYRELNEKANRLAKTLRDKGVQANTRVALMAGRSLEMIAGIMGILKAGGAYVPIAPDYPAERIKLILNECGSPLLLTQSHVRAASDFFGEQGASGFTGEVLDLDMMETDASGYADNLPLINTSGDLAYVMYTSGSTGQPKGNLTVHHNISRVVKNTDYIDISEQDTLLQLSNFVFDGSVFDIFGALLNGASLVLIQKEEVLDPEKLSSLLRKEQVTIFFITTALFNTLVDTNIECFGTIRKVLFGGERVSFPHVKELYAFIGPGKILHMYGPTETTVFATCYKVDELDESMWTIPIGKPISRTSAYILNDRGSLQPIGIPGELWIAGDGVARGYLDRPDQTEERFVPNPFSVGERMYRTGDIARWLPDGNIEFWGRLDHQVKIRGFRIELGEIEKHLLSNEFVKEAIVVARQDASGQKYLCAYVVLHAGKSTRHLRGYLSQSLPDYMIPASFVALDRLPLTVNGKVDQKQLPEPDITWDALVPYEPPATPVEEALTGIWESVLGRAHIGVGHSFFDLGGDSIKAIQVIARLNTFGLKLEMKDLFQYPTIRTVSPWVKRRTRSIDQGVTEGEVPLTPVQRWFFEHKKEGTDHFNQAVMLFSPNGFDEPALRKSLDELWLHHDALRMIYNAHADGVRQFNRGAVGCPVQWAVYDFTNRSDAYHEIEKIASDLQAGLDLSAGKLLTAGIFRTDEGSHLLLAIHHLVVDGVSWRILLEDLNSIYSQALAGKTAVLPEKTDSFKLWAEQLSDYANSPSLLKEIPYWTQLEKTDVSSLPKRGFNMRQDSEAPRASIAVRLHAAYTRQLLGEVQVHQRYNTEINDLLLAALGLVVAKRFGMEVFPLNLEGHGREEIIEGIDITRTVGWFTTMFPIVLDLSQGSELSWVIRNTKETIRKVPNRGIGYGLLKSLTRPENKQCLDFKLEPQISFNYLGQFNEEPTTAGFSMSPLSPGRSISEQAESRFSLDINAIISGSELLIEIGYSRQEYEAEEIEQLAHAYIQELETVIDHCALRTERQYTPSDFQDRGLTIRELDGILERYAGSGAIQSIYPLTPMQQGMLFHYLMNPGTSAYVEQLSVEIEGTLNLDLLNVSLGRLLDKYEVLRTNFVYSDIQIPRQIVFSRKTEEVQFYDISGADQAETAIRVEQIKASDIQRGFDLARDTLIRMVVLKIGEDRQRLIWTFHHINLDGWCVGIIYQDFIQMYLELVSGTPSHSEPVPPYSAYIRWLEKQDAQEALSYWQHYLEEYSQYATLPKSAASHGNDPSGQLEFSFDREITKRLSELASGNRVTVNTVVQAIWGILLQKYNNTSDVVFGSVVSGRPPEIPGIEQMVGIFINTIPVRVRTEAEQTFAGLLAQVQQNAMASSKYEYASLAEIQSVSELKQSLLDHILVFENYPEYEERQASFEGSPLKFHMESMSFFEQTNFDFNLIVSLRDKLNVKFLYNKDVFTKASVERIQGHLRAVVRQLLADPALPLAGIDIVTDEEKQVLNDYNRTAAPYPKEHTIHGLFEEQVERTPDRVAVVMGEEQLTYRELNEQANRLARVLREKGVGPDRIVGIAVHRSLEMIIGLMAIHKAGGAYLPIQPEDPVDRVLFTLEDSGAALVLTQRNLLEPLRPLGAERELLGIEDVLEQAAGLSGANLEPVNVSSDLVYVIYTSGSTGRPKGVMIEHASLINRLNWMQHRMPFGAEDVILQKTPYTFDVSLWELFSWAIQGARLCFLPPGGEKDPGLIADTIEAHGITAIHFVPSMLGAFLDVAEQEELIGRLGNVKRVFASGEALMSEHVKRFNRLWRASSGATLHNLYGPTEATVEVAYYDCPPEAVPGSIPIGRPLDNVRLYVLDKADRLMPVGVPGELHIGGDCLARGYLNRPDLTAEKFVRDPFADGGRMYRTGDLARWLPDGNIEYLGRIDHQVKIRGYRIELGEIEAALLAQDGVKEAVVLARDDRTGGQFLCAYIVGKPGVTAAKLRQNLTGHLQEYMIPAFFVLLDQMPLTASGKADRRTLMEMDLGLIQNVEYAEPRTELEKQLAEAWQSIFDLPKVGIDDNFFDLGGHSLTAIQLVSKMQQTTGLEIRLNSLFHHPTIRSLTQHGVESDTSLSVSLRTFESVEHLLQEKFGIRSSLRQVSSGNETLQVLHLEGSSNSASSPSHDEMLELIAAHFDEADQPHYITAASEDDLSLETLNVDEVRHEWKQQIDSMLEAFVHSILRLPVIDLQPVSPTQSYHLEHDDISGTVMTFEKYLNVKHLEKAIHQVIRNHDLMRSVLVKADGEWVWQVYDNPDPITLPFVDLSGVSRESQEMLLHQVIWPYFYKNHEQNGSLMYRILLVKKNLKEYLLLLPFSHSIFDYMSGEIIKNQISQYYESFQAGKQLQDEAVGRYWDFTAQIQSGPVNLSDPALVALYELEAFEDNIRRVSEVAAAQSLLIGHTAVRLDVSAADLDGRFGTAELWQLAFSSFAGLCERYFELNQAPIWVANYGRSFKGERYFDVIGEFVDYVPILAKNWTDPSALEQKVKHKLQLAAEHNISFANLTYHTAMEQFYPRSARHLQQAMDAMPIVFNYLGELRSEHRVLQSVDLGNANIEGRKRILCEVWHDEAGNLSMALALPYIEEAGMVRSQWQEAVDQLTAATTVTH
ncbi:amino acid adenylation domain-containing protein [Paenibacillus sp. SYP-B3998]|uniref:Amino acid adenylation domain-containing protein n=1 Tax=Paenibacillus sp. SYP-B3998 TaxID=2678564 RepID=A0A6G4A234_9BACL|nr:non-ribosomal peptide synthetase [Paenibacillus sp. SYP-B3998]NEW07889.1 amino acid adenylation domain-containing protein [Paenibacillus sp. SYP-B3998]